MLSQKEFYDYVKDNIKDYLPDSYKDAAVTLEETIKNNDIKLTGIRIERPGDEVVPRIYLDGLYSAYRDGNSLESCIKEAADMCAEHEPLVLNPSTDRISDYSAVKNNLQIRLCDPEINQKRLEGMVYTMHGDFAATYHVVVGQSEEGIYSMPVMDQMLKAWDVSLEQLHADALKANAAREPGLYSLADMRFYLDMKLATNYLDEEQLDWNEAAELPLYSFTNGSNLNGASLILQDELLEKIGELMHGDFYVLPSSIHEVLIVPESLADSISEDFTTMVRSINNNKDAIKPEDVLSDKVQYYDRDEKILESLHSREQRLQSAEKDEKAPTAEKEEKTAEKPKSIRERMAAAKEEIKSTVSEKKAKDRTAELAM